LKVPLYNGANFYCASASCNVRMGTEPETLLILCDFRTLDDKTQEPSCFISCNERTYKVILELQLITFCFFFSNRTHISIWANMTVLLILLCSEPCRKITFLTDKFCWLHSFDHRYQMNATCNTQKYQFDLFPYISAAWRYKTVHCVTVLTGAMFRVCTACICR
jgi:hypothetical protein